jgi:transposase
MGVSAGITIEPPATEAPSDPKRRRYSIAEKRRIVEESFQPTVSVARVARAHGINANQVFRWRGLYRRGKLGGTVQAAPDFELLPVTISDPPPQSTPTLAPPTTRVALPAGSIQLQLPRGRLRIEGSVDPDSLRVVLECMLA